MNADATHTNPQAMICLADGENFGEKKKKRKKANKKKKLNAEKE
jgi:hypothetical protein